VYNVPQISEGTNSGGFSGGIWAFAYVLLAVGFLTNYKFKINTKWKIKKY
jgi:hypothetical protein